MHRANKYDVKILYYWWLYIICIVFSDLCTSENDRFAVWVLNIERNFDMVYNKPQKKTIFNRII